MTAPAASAKIPIAILASGRGTNFDAIHGSIRAGRLDAQIVAVLSDRMGAPVLSKAREAGIKALYVAPPPAGGPKPVAEKRLEHDRKVVEALAPFAPKFLVMAGYMRIVSPRLIETFRSERGYSRIVNVHPSLLPSFPGVDAYGQAFRFGCGVAGVSVHLVENDVDSGPLCAQESFSIADCKTKTQVEERGLAVEHRLYPDTLQWVLPERFDVEKREKRLCVRPH